MKIGDIVANKIQESGIIVSPWIGTEYDWWVDITFTYDGKEYTSTIPYREHELKLKE